MTTSALDSVREALRDSEADALIVTRRRHVRKLSGFTGSSGILIVTANAVSLLTDGRYTEQAGQETQGIDISIVAGNPVAAVTSSPLVQTSGMILVQGDSMTAADYVALSSSVGLNKVRVVSEFLDPLLSPKAADEVQAIARAQKITDSVYSALPGFLAPGVTEKEVAASLTAAHLEKGADKMSFDPIVAFGSNSSRPHARPGNRELRTGDPILVDFGCSLDGYCSDMTRMLVAGKPDQELLGIVEIVAHAKAEAIRSAHAGMSCRDLDTVAREVISKHGFGRNFVHSLGHGIGLDVHEWPHVSQRSTAPLQVGDVITIEPGIYLQDKFGVRLEDIVCITEHGCQVLTESRTDLYVLSL